MEKDTREGSVISSKPRRRYFSLISLICTATQAKTRLIAFVIEETDSSYSPFCCVPLFFVPPPPLSANSIDLQQLFGSER